MSDPRPAGRCVISAELLARIEAFDLDGPDPPA
jgi:hypothetical protein